MFRLGPMAKGGGGGVGGAGDAGHFKARVWPSGRRMERRRVSLLGSRRGRAGGGSYLNNLPNQRYAYGILRIRQDKDGFEKTQWHPYSLSRSIENYQSLEVIHAEIVGQDNHNGN